MSSYFYIFVLFTLLMFTIIKKSTNIIKIDISHIYFQGKVVLFNVFY